MTLPELASALAPIAEQFAHELALEVADFPSDHGACVTCRPAHDAASILCSVMHALDQAADGRPELLRALTIRVGFAPSVQELVTK